MQLFPKNFKDCCYLDKILRHKNLLVKIGSTSQNKRSFNLNKSAFVRRAYKI